MRYLLILLIITAMNTFIKIVNLLTTIAVILASGNSCSFHNDRAIDDYALITASGNGLCPHENNKDCIHDIPVEWTQHSRYDSLSVFCSDGKRGYYNSYNDKIVIPAQYERAWIFSDGLAAVQEGENIGFIDHNGNVVIDFMFPYHGNPISDFVFSHGVCVVADDEGKCGVIDKSGKWIIDPEWDSVSTYESYVIVTKSGVSQQIAYDGNVINSFVIEDFKELIYSRVEQSEYVVGHKEEKEVMYYTGLYAYQIGERWGMMDSNCNILTEPLYEYIYAVDQNIFRAVLLDGYHEVILNAKGKVMNRINVL